MAPEAIEALWNEAKQLTRGSGGRQKLKQ